MHPIGYTINKKIDFIPYRVFFIEMNMELSACGYLVTNYRQQKLIEKETVEFK